MKKIYSLLIATFCLLVACEKDEIQMWDPVTMCSLWKSIKIP